MEETVTHHVLITKVDWTWPLLAVGFVLLNLAVIGLVVVRVAGRRRVSSSIPDSKRKRRN